MRKRNQEPFNLFELKFNPNSPMFQSGREQLQARYFSFDSPSPNVSSAFNETCLRALSTFSRVSVLNSNSKNIPKEFKIDKHNFKPINLDNICSDDIIQVANGQIRS